MLDTGTATITTDCTCEEFDEDTGTYEPGSYCYGDCWDWAWEDATSLIASWAKHWDTNGIRIEAQGMTWQSLSACAEITFHNDAEEALRLFTLDSDYRLEVSVGDDGQLTARRYSHDEPMGCSMVAYPVSMLD